MAQNLSQTARPRERGEGMIYKGSMVEHHGQRVLIMDDCPCIIDQQFDTLDPRKRVTVLLENGVRLFHARHSSFEWPQDRTIVGAPAVPFSDDV